MKKFLLAVLKFATVPFVLALLVLLLPPTPRAKTSLLFGYYQKDSLLKELPAPRLILLGGSNLSFGINSQMLEEDLQMKVINTGVHAAIGLKFMLENTLEHVKEGDLILLVPEYHHFWVSYHHGTDELLRMVLDVYPLKVFDLSASQLLNLMPLLPKYLKSKFELGEYRKVVEPEFYGRHSFNEYGDVFQHWDNEKLDFAPSDIGGDYHPEIINHLKDFVHQAEKKGASVLLTYPCLQDESFDLLKSKIKTIEDAYSEAGFQTLGNPEDYVLPDSLMFNTYYHPLKKGLDLRSQQMIQDLKKWQKKNEN